jgi:3-oxoacyl-[acyl-carrier protein] reductase
MTIQACRPRARNLSMARAANETACPAVTKGPFGLPFSDATVQPRRVAQTKRGISCIEQTPHPSEDPSGRNRVTFRPHVERGERGAKAALGNRNKGERMKAGELFDLSGQVALITGASSGLGVRFAEVLAANGAAVVLAARRLDRIETVRARIEAAGGRAIAVAADVTDRAAMRAAFDAAENAFGTVTVLVNNAGVAHSDRAVEIGEEEWRRVLDTNLDAVFFWAQEAARRMLAAKKAGAIVNIASILAFGVGKGVVAYTVAKAGVVQLTKALALELAFKGVRVNAIAPGYVVTEISREWLEGEGAKMTRDIPAGRFGEERDLDGALLLLASDAGRYINGATIVVDGGQVVALRGA